MNDKTLFCKAMTTFLDKCYLSLFFTLLVPTGQASAEIFKWVDSDGKTHYSDSVPKTDARAQSNAEVLPIEDAKPQPKPEKTKPKPSSTAKPQSNESRKTDELKEKEQEFQARREARLAKEQQEMQAEQLRKSQCENARSALNTATDAYNMERNRYPPVPSLLSETYGKLQQAQATEQTACK